MKRLRRLCRVAFGRKVWETLAEAGGYGLLIAAATLEHETAGLVVGGLVLLNYAYGFGRNK